MCASSVITLQTFQLCCRPAASSSLPPYKLIAAAPAPQHVPVVLHSQHNSWPYGHQHLSAALASVPGQAGRHGLQPRQLFAGGPQGPQGQNGRVSVLQHQCWQQHQRLLLQHVLQQTVTALERSSGSRSSAQGQVSSPVPGTWSCQNQLPACHSVTSDAAHSAVVICGFWRGL